MKETLIAHGIALGIIVGVILLIFTLIGNHDKDVWNGGCHSCGGQWIYQGAVGHAYSTGYLYGCDNCGKTHEFLIKR